MQLNMKLLIKYTAIIIMILAVFSLVHSVLLNTIPSMANEIIGVLLAGIMVRLYLKWREAMHFENTIVNIQFIEA